MSPRLSDCTRAFTCAMAMSLLAGCAGHASTAARETKSIGAPGKQTIIDEPKHRNKVLLLELGPEDGKRTIETHFDVVRLEKAAYPEALPDRSIYLRPNALVPITDEMLRLGKQAIAGKTTDLMRARALYDPVIERMSYKRVGKHWGKGNAAIACDTRSGNCSDYHAYFVGVARAVGIPARFAVGAAIPSARDEGGISGYQCWAEFYADGKWWPIDVSEGDKYSNLSSYYFGHHPANRIELSRGQNLVLEPGPTSGPISFLAYPVFEVGDRPVIIKPQFSFVRRQTP